MADLRYLLNNDGDRFEPKSQQSLMKAVVTTGNGGYDKLGYRDVAVPVPGPVLIRVLGAGVKNTDTSTRIGWYSSSVKGGTEQSPAIHDQVNEDGGWNEGTPFPLIQGTHCCGRVVAQGGRYAWSGAIAGPIVSMDMRDFYLKDLSLIGCTAWQ